MPSLTVLHLRPLILGISYIFPKFIFLFFGLITVFVTLNHKIDLVWDRLNSQSYVENDASNFFDFIIVGGGSSGSVLAYRLSKDFQVLLLEAGGDPILNDIPATGFILINQPYYDWQFYTEPQKNACLGMKNNQCFWPRGLGLGGSSNLNAIIYARGSYHTYDNWANITGDQRWSYSNVLKAFKKSENYVGSDFDSRYHSTRGLLKVNRPAAGFTGMADSFLRAGEELGYKTIDINSKFDQGFDKITNTQDEMGKRHGTYKAYIQPAKKYHKKLTIKKFSTVNKILFRNGNEAYGVTYERFGRTEKAFAKKEIVISAGSIGSPKIMMLSGIGPREHLESLEITVIADLPVGKNLQDHTVTYPGPFIVDKPVTFNVDKMELNLNLMKPVLDYYLKGNGIMSTTGVEATGFSSSKRAKTDGQENWPDIQWLLYPINIPTITKGQIGHVAERILNFKKDTFDEFLQPVMDSTQLQETFHILTVGVRPKSRGRVLLRGMDPSLKPIIEANYFENKSDLQVILEGIRKSIELVENSTEFGPIARFCDKCIFPMCSHHQIRSDEYFICLIKHISFTLFHPVGTCSMGSSGSKEAVVNSKLEVIGIKRLRVIDASIMPVIPNANTNAAAIMIGEMGSEIILQKWTSYVKKILTER